MAIVTTNTNLSAGSYIAGEQIEIKNGAVLTVDSTPSVLPGTILCITSGKLRVVNNSLTTPIRFSLLDMNRDFRFEANGIMEVRGQMMEVGTGTGAAQTFNLGTMYGGVIDDLTYVDVEAAPGLGVYRPWPIIPIDLLFYHAGRTDGGGAVADFVGTPWEAGKVAFWHYRNRELSFGNNTNGWSVPTGCKVRIPNILITNDYATDASLVHAIVSEGAPTGGTFTITITNRKTGTVLGTTAAIAFNATAAVIDTAIEAVTGANTVTSGSGPLPAAVSITWAGSLASTPLALTVNSSVTGGSSSVVYTREWSAVNLSLLDLNPSGTIDAENCMFSQKIRVVTDAFSSVRLVNSGFGADGLQFNNSNGDVTLQSVCSTAGPYVVAANSHPMNVLGAVSIDNLMYSGRRSNARMILSALPGLTKFDNSTSLGYASPNRLAVNRDGINIATVKPNVAFNNIVSVGGRLIGTNLIGNTWNNLKIADGSQLAQTTNAAVSGVQFHNSVDQKLLAPGMAGPMAPRNYILSADVNSLNIEVFGGAFDGGNNTMGLVNPNGKTTNLVNTTCTNMRSGPFVDQPATYTASGIKMQKVFGTFATAQSGDGFDVAQDAVYDLVSSNVAGITEGFASVENYVGGNFADPSLTPSTGHVTFGPVGKGAGLTLTGAAYTNQAGRLYFTNDGDTAELEIPFAMHGITSFQNVVPFIRAELQGAVSSTHIIINNEGITGGTFTVSVYDSAGVLLGTSVPLAYNVPPSGTMQPAIRAIHPDISLSTVAAGGSLGGGYVITLIGASSYYGKVTVDGSLLTGGTNPNIAYAFGRTALLGTTESYGSVNTIEFAVKTPTGIYGGYQPLNGTNLAGAVAALAGYSANDGLFMKLKITSGANNPWQFVTQISMPTNINPSLWVLPDASVVLNGPDPTDVVEVVSAGDNTVLYTFTGSGLQEFSIGANYGVEVFFVRKTAAGLVLARTTVARKLNVGTNEVVNLFAGEQVQIAQSGQLTSLDELIRERLDVALSTRSTQVSLDALASNNQTEHDATQAAIATRPAPLDSTQTQAAAAAALMAYDGVVPADLAGLATAANVTAAQVAIIAEVDAIPTNPLLTTDSRLNNLDAAISSRSTLTAPQVRTELATELGRIDVAVSTRLAASAYTAPTAAPTAADNATAVRTNLATELARIDAAVSSRATPANVTAAQTAITGEINANETKIDAVKADTAAIKLKTDAQVNGPTAAQIRTELETVGALLHKTFKAATSWWR